MPNLQLAAQLEAVLFMATEPLSVKQLSAATAMAVPQVKEALGQLDAALAGRGVMLSQSGGLYRLVTVPAASQAVARFTDDSARTELSRAALETLAIVAYRGPVTRSGIEMLRGVSSDSLLRTLVGRDLVVEAGRSTSPGHPMQYTVSTVFLDHFGLKNLQELPALEPHEPTEAAHAH